MLKRIWTDPVWSKVISVGIIGLISFVYALLKSNADKVAITDVYENLFQFKVKIIYVLAAIIIFVIIKRLTKKKNKSIYSPKQQKLQEFNKFEDEQSGILYRWGVYFDNKTPFIADLVAYCTKHEGPPMKFFGTSCPINNCTNQRQSVNYHLVKNHIESILIDHWDKIK